MRAGGRESGTRIFFPTPHTRPAPNQADPGKTVTTNYAYDSLNRVTRKTYSDGVTPEVDFVYDQPVAPMSPSAALSNVNGRLAYAFSPNSAMDIYSYDPMGRTTDMWQCVTAPCASAWHAQQGYDLGGDLTSLGYNGGAALTYQYDGTQRITQVTGSGLSNLTSPLFGNTTYGPVGLLNATLGNNVPEFLSYDNRTRLYSLGTSSAGTPPEPGTGTITVSGSEQSTVLQYNCYPGTCYQTIYDGGSFTVSVNGSQVGAVSYGQYDTCTSVAANLAASINGSASVVTAVVNGCTVQLAATTQGLGTDYPLSVSATTYNSQYFSSPSFTGTASGSTLTGGTNPTNATGAVYNFTLTYAGNGDVLAANDRVNGNWTYGYDAFNRLTSGAKTGVSHTWDYDRFGNRWHQTQVGVGGQSLTFNGSNQLTNLGYVYDAAGNLMMDNVNCYSYDAENRLVSTVPETSGFVCGAAATNGTDYLYDPDGRRVAKLQNGAIVKQFYYDAAGQEIAETNGSGTLTRAEIFAGARHLATWNNNATFFSHSDWLGTERVRTFGSGAQAGQQCETITSLPFGDGLAEQPQNGGCGDPSPNHFTGKERDSESGLDNFGARYNSSSMGRFMSPDWSAEVEPVPYAKLDNPQSLNLYSYVLNNPLSNVDINGHTTTCGGSDGSLCKVTMTEITQNVSFYDKKGNVISTVKVTTDMTTISNSKTGAIVSANGTGTAENVSGRAFSSSQLGTIGSTIAGVQQAGASMALGSNPEQLMTAITAKESTLGIAAPLNPLQLSCSSGTCANGDAGHNIRGALNVLHNLGRKSDYDPASTYNRYNGVPDPIQRATNVRNFMKIYDGMTQSSWSWSPSVPTPPIPAGLQ